MITSAGTRQTKTIAAAEAWVKAHWQNNPELMVGSDRDIQSDLWHIWQGPQNQSTQPPLALLCLRCWTSHQIAAACYQLASQFGQNYGFDAHDLWPLVLDDDGKLDTPYKSLSVQILEHYDPSQAALSTWANRMTKSHREINQFCLEKGLYRISDWALLNDTSAEALGKALLELSAGEVIQKTTLLRRYHQVYRRDRITYRQTAGRASRCQEPTLEQLQEMLPEQPPAHVLMQLGELAAQLRRYRIAMRRGMPLTQSFDAMVETQQSIVQYTSQDEPEDSSAQDEFVQRYRQQFLASLDDAIEWVARGFAASYDKKKAAKGQLFLSALTLFHCKGLSMGAIAQKIGLSSQVQVTRLLKLKRFRMEVCAYWFNQLKQQVESDALQLITPERLSVITQQLNTVLSEETETVMAEAAAEAQISKNRSTASTFARRLCKRIPLINRAAEVEPADK